MTNTIVLAIFKWLFINYDLLFFNAISVWFLFLIYNMICIIVIIKLCLLLICYIIFFVAIFKWLICNIIIRWR